MTLSRFVHLRVHSAYSLSEGAIRIKELVQLCKDRNMPAVAVSDSGNLFGALEFALAASGGGVQPIIGCVLAVKREVQEPATTRTPTPERVLILVQDEAGYRNLLKLVSKSFLETPDDQEPHVTLLDLERWSQGLLLLTGGSDGPLARALLSGNDDLAETLLQRLKVAFPGRCYIEVQRHGLPDEEATEERLIELAYAHDLPLVATNDAYFAKAEQYEAHDALLCIAGSTYILESDRRRLTPEHRFKSSAEMEALFEDLPEAIDNTQVIARRCSYFPTFVKPILPPFETEGGRGEVEELRAQARAGLEHRLEAHVYEPEDDEAAREAKAAPYRQRLDYELGIIEEMGFPGYFLIVADFIKWAKAQEIPVGPGRGSGAGSVVAYALTITDLDPLRWGLLFERFLNPERVSMPDFDVDFCQDRRDEVIRYVQERYGRDKVAQIITFGKLQARAVLRDVGRVLQLPYGQVDRLCKLVPNNPANPVTLQQALDGEPQLQAAREEDETVGRMIDIALELEGLYRHASTHAAGVVIGDRPLDELVPLYRDPRSDMPVTQFNMRYVEQAGLVKFDFLGLKTLTVLARARDLIREHSPDFDLVSLPLDDTASYTLMARGDTVGVFQLESTGMRDALKRLKPDRFEDVIAMVALYRPGPMENIPAYIRRKKGEEEPDYLYPSLEPILKETFGIMIYQEQVMQIAQELAGYSLGAADLLRRAMGKKIKAEMDAQREIFVQGATERGVPEDKARAIFEQVNKFAGYGFNKSHAAAYALVAYQTAYLKANYPVEFMAAIMTYDMGNTDKLNLFRQELDRLRIRLLPPDVNHSFADFAVEALPEGGKAIRYALGAIKNVGATAMKQLVAEREEKGAFASLGDFARRIDARSINKRAIENLVCAGAMDSLEPNRQRAHLAAESIVRHAATAANERDSGQFSLLGGAAQPETLKLQPVSDWPAIDRLQKEFDALGFYLSAHPLDSYRNLLQRRRVVSTADLPKAVIGGQSRQVLAGIVVAKQERTSKKGSRFAFVQLSDATGVFEVTCFSETLGRCRALLEGGKPLLVTVSVERQGEEGDLRLTAHEFEDLDEALAKTAAGLKLFVQEREPLVQLQQVLEKERRGRSRVTVVLALEEEREVEIDLPGAYALSPACRQAIKSLPGLVVEDL
ncbi:DNA polymerase III subunit alpha [Aquibaculum arenosum]|uniref:DNA polymerase III subunit alpha n=1 Tax=Aquibaculum arenosum TaxID=3032591 RepID=A0ABT5YIH6_9PROT|nr:DNA polymerase III subunit alpha [Fodinicurvata sp. CAU 1616]MDF2094745.1 DNA polymerase III subunit alpha [Fodinicurvata sp. CAU 1616]